MFSITTAEEGALIDDGIRPDYLLISSMGIYAAAAIAAAVEPRLIAERGPFGNPLADAKRRGLHGQQFSLSSRYAMRIVTHRT
jgi:hypothetical protein